MELIHAALRTASPNSLFLLRDRLSLENLPEEFSSSFRDNTLLAQRSLNVRINQLKIIAGPIFLYKLNCIDGVIFFFHLDI